MHATWTETTRLQRDSHTLVQNQITQKEDRGKTPKHGQTEKSAINTCTVLNGRQKEVTVKCSPFSWTNEDQGSIDFVTRKAEKSCFQSQFPQSANNLHRQMDDRTHLIMNRMKIHNCFPLDRLYEKSQKHISNPETSWKPCSHILNILFLI